MQKLNLDVNVSIISKNVNYIHQNLRMKRYYRGKEFLKSYTCLHVHASTYSQFVLKEKSETIFLL